MTTESDAEQAAQAELGRVVAEYDCARDAWERVVAEFYKAIKTAEAGP